MIGKTDTTLGTSNRGEFTTENGLKKKNLKRARGTEEEKHYDPGLVTAESQAGRGLGEQTSAAVSGAQEALSEAPTRSVTASRSQDGASRP